MTIADISEARAVLGVVSSISDADLGLLSLLHPMVEAAIKDHLGYNPEQATHTGELYPRHDEAVVGDAGQGTWDSDGTSAFFRGNDGMGSNILMLRHLPVRSISSLRVDYNSRGGTRTGSFGSDTELTQGEHFYPDFDQAGICRSGIVYRVGASWPSEPGSIKITYVAGYTVAEFAGYDADVNASPIKQVVLTEWLKAFKAFKIQGKQGRAGFVGGPLNSESLGAYSYSTDGSMAGMLAGFKVSLTPESVARLESFVHMGRMLL